LLIPSRRLAPPVDETRDHILGASDAQITLVEYGSYACPHCRAANDTIASLRDRFGDRMRYVFRHRPLANNELARRAAEMAECAAPEQFWKVHVELMTRSETLTEDDLAAIKADLNLDTPEVSDRARVRVDQDERTARANGVTFTPTFFINGRRYDGPWDEVTLGDAMLGTLGHRVRATALDFASWGPSAGVLLLIATVLALVLSNSPVGDAFAAFWHRELGLNLGGWRFGMSLQHWVNDGLLTIFFMVVGLEIKREFTVGHLANRRSAALPIAAAVGGMIVPALLYLLIIPGGSLARGWGVPMATDTAFAIALIAMLGRRVPLELRVFLTAAAIVDDIGAILVIAVFHAADLQIVYLVAAAGALVVLGLLNQARVYLVFPYILTGVVLWACIYAGGLHATLAGVLLALFIPTRPPPNLHTLMMQADAILLEEAKHGGEVLRHGPSLPALNALEFINELLESPADRLLRRSGARSSYFVLPIFALANAGVVLSADVLDGRGPLVLAIITGLVLGKPLGLVGASMIAVRIGMAEKPGAYSWRQLAGAGALAGIGFTMSLFVADRAFPNADDFAVAKVAILAASVCAGIIGTIILWNAKSCAGSWREFRLWTNGD
jgi:Na+:H+ antiporter, NhaA family